MPIPNPEKNEDQNSFIGRCNSILSEEYKDIKQRNAICYSQWEKSKEDSIDNIDRNDCFNIDSKTNLRLDNVTGFLYSKARVTRSGVFDYYDSNGNLMRELRSPEEVFDSNSMSSLSLKPIVNDHPDVMVTTDNIKELQVGMIGDTVEKDGIFLSANIVITDKDMVDIILHRKAAGLSTELSCGYSCTLIPEIGKHDSEGYYTFKQTNIRYNHVGIVDKARAGKDVKILDKLNKKKEFNMDKVQFTRNSINLDNFKIDAVSGSFDNESIGVISTFSTKLDDAANIIVSLNKDKDSLQGKLDQANELITSLNTKLDSLSNIDSVESINMFNDRKNVLDIASKLEIDCKDKNINDIKIDCIKKVSEDFNADGKSQDYINARFDSIDGIIALKNANDSKNTFSKFMNNVKDRTENNEKISPRENFIKMDKEKNRVN